MEIIKGITITPKTEEEIKQNPGATVHLVDEDGFDIHNIHGLHYSAGTTNEQIAAFIIHDDPLFCKYFMDCLNFDSVEYNIYLSKNSLIFVFSEKKIRMNAIPENLLDKIHEKHSIYLEIREKNNIIIGGTLNI